MSEMVVMNTGTYIQYKVVKVGDEYKVLSMNGLEAKIKYSEIESGLQSGKYKKMS